MFVVRERLTRPLMLFVVREADEAIDVVRSQRERDGRSH